MSDEKGVLSRWSERKLRVAEEKSKELEKMPPPAVATELDEEPDPFEGKTDDEIFAMLELPTPEELTLGDRAEGYLAPNVPERIRQRALRAFWRTNPVLANVDGLDDYCDDFTDAAMVAGDIQTIYEVGKGYAQKAIEALESMADDESEQVASELIAEVGGELTADQEAQDSLEEKAPQEEEETLGIEPPSPAEWDAAESDDPVQTVAVRPRRMQFRDA